jgi:neutral ceramidase
MIRRPKYHIKLTPWLFLVMLSTGCAVVKTPYFREDYYSETINGLERLKPGTEQADDILYAGFSKRSLIPDSTSLSQDKRKKHRQIPIAGYGQLKTKYAAGIHDTVFVRAVALKAGSRINIILSGEMLIMPPNIIDQVITNLNEKGIQRDHLFFSATHTHSGIGGWGYGLLARVMAGKRNRNIEEWLGMQIQHAVHDAIDDLKRARLGISSFDAPDYTVNRLTRDPAHNNTLFDYVLIEQINGRKAVIGTYSAHSTTITSSNNLISGDYPGYWSRKMERSGTDIALFCAGSMGGQSPAGKDNEFESTAFIGESLADSVLAGLGRINMSDSISISSISLKTVLPEYHLRMTAGRNFSTRMSERLMASPENVYLQALEINDRIWFFTPGDFSGESAILLRKLFDGKQYRTVVTGYNGSYVGYILPGKYFYLDHYEPKTMSWFGPGLGDYFFELMDRMAGILID